MDNLFEQLTQITKANAYDIVSKQRDELVIENERLKQLEKSFYMNICRAYNAGKENQNTIISNINNSDAAFISSHQYFIIEFPNFKTNVP